MTEREPYSKPAEPVVVGSVGISEVGFGGTGADLGIYSSLL